MFNQNGSRTRSVLPAEVPAMVRVSTGWRPDPWRRAMFPWNAEAGRQFQVPTVIQTVRGLRYKFTARAMTRLIRFDHRVVDLGKLVAGRLVNRTMFDRITFSPNIVGGRACIRGMRIKVSLVVNLVANGMSIDEIVREYPDLEPDDVRQALSYAPALANEGVHLFTTQRLEVSGQGARSASSRRRSRSPSRGRTLQTGRGSDPGNMKKE
jgi:uncharacterized protein (DUF433 family)